MSRWPWGSGPAPALDCHECGKRIGKQRGHYILDGGDLLCGGCLMPDRSYRSAQQRLHAKYYPHCPVDWHDMWDHKVSSATRAAAWFVLSGQLDEKLQR